MEHPHFTTDPERIYAYSRSDGLVSFRWDGTDGQGQGMATGVYFYRLETAGERIQKKMLLLK